MWHHQKVHHRPMQEQEQLLLHRLRQLQQPDK
jgi:hypothetical protein